MKKSPWIRREYFSSIVSLFILVRLIMFDLSFLFCSINSESAKKKKTLKKKTLKKKKECVKNILKCWQRSQKMKQQILDVCSINYLLGLFGFETFFIIKQLSEKKFLYICIIIMSLRYPAGWSTNLGNLQHFEGKHYSHRVVFG